MPLTKQHLEELRRPFAAEAVKFRLDAKNPNAQGKYRCVVFIDARLAVERLNDVDPNWNHDPLVYLAGGHADPMGVKEYAPASVALTVHGVTRHGVGQLGSTKPDAKYAKSVESDAIKRAAVKFGVGSYLYALPSFFVDEKGVWKKDDKAAGLTRGGVQQLRQQYSKAIEDPKFRDRFGTVSEYGDIEDDYRSIDEPETGAQIELLTTAPNAPKGRKVRTA